MGCSKNNCSDCDGNYPAIASAFIRVPNNFNSVNNSIDKFTIYKSLHVVKKAVENVGGRGSRHCAELGDNDPFDFHNGCDDHETLGFLEFPLRVRTDLAQVCGEVRCAKDGYSGDCGCADECCSGCGDIDCGPNLLGYIQWPKHEVVKDIRACGPIEENIACDDRRQPRCGGDCRVVLDCDKCNESHSKTSRRSRRRSGRHHKSRKGGCGCH